MQVGEGRGKRGSESETRIENVRETSGERDRKRENEVERYR